MGTSPDPPAGAGDDVYPLGWASTAGNDDHPLERRVAGTLNGARPEVAARRDFRLRGLSFGGTAPTAATPGSSKCSRSQNGHRRHQGEAQDGVRPPEAEPGVVRAAKRCQPRSGGGADRRRPATPPTDRALNAHALCDHCISGLQYRHSALCAPHSCASGRSEATVSTKATNRKSTSGGGANAAPEVAHRWFAAIYDRMSAGEERGFMGEMRRELLADVRGDVLEIGAGTGANFTYYLDTARVIALEPDPYMRRRAEARLATLVRPNITLLAAPAESLPVDDAFFDVVISTLVLCTVRDLPRALEEISRVLRPGGQLHFIEHVRGTGFAGRTQDFIKPVWRHLGAGCHPNRRTQSALHKAGFNVSITNQRTMMGFMPLIAGTAARPA